MLKNSPFTDQDTTFSTCEFDDYYKYFIVIKFEVLNYGPICSAFRSVWYVISIWAERLQRKKVIVRRISIRFYSTTQLFAVSGHKP